MFWSKHKKNEYPCQPQFYYIKVGCNGIYITRTCYPDEWLKSVEIKANLCKRDSACVILRIRVLDLVKFTSGREKMVFFSAVPPTVILVVIFFWTVTVLLSTNL